MPGGVFGPDTAAGVVGFGSPRGRPGRRGTAALVLAVAALVVASAAVAVSMLALSRGDTSAAGRLAPPAASGGPAARSEPSQPPAGNAAGPSASGTGPTGSALPPEPTASVSPGGIDPSAAFVVVYQAQHLTLQPACGGEPRYVDLDEPRAGATPTKSEIYYYTNCSSLTADLRFAARPLPVAKVGSALASPGDCAEAIRTSPIDFPLAPSQGDHLCIVTDAAQAQSEGISQKIVLLTIDSISKDGALSVSLTAWRVPA